MERWQDREVASDLRVSSPLWSLSWGVMVRELGRDLVLEDVGAADTEMEITHGLGRIPRGMAVVNQEVPSGTTPAQWYRVTGDGAWDERVIRVRWTVANARVLVRVW